MNKENFSSMIRNAFIASSLVIVTLQCKSPSNEYQQVKDYSKEDNQQNPLRSSQPTSNDPTESGDDCDLEDGEYSAAVDYTNPATGYSNNYTLEVDVENCNVIQINFPRGGYLGPHHIDPSSIDADGDATVVDDQGRTFQIHIDKDDDAEKDDSDDESGNDDD